ncbi:MULTISPECIES: hypothetical protein [Bacteroides]|uniref:hypothetical protein n=1 Tax=Bacteroides TaxID=816 RepID=UPI0025B3C02D|nr:MULTISPECIES: hypothetical protein [Bacteroides]
MTEKHGNLVSEKIYGRRNSMLTVVIFITGFLVGCGITVAIFKQKCIGALRVDTSDPDGPFIFLEASKSIDFIASKKSVMLEVNLKNYISHD